MDNPLFSDKDYLDTPLINLSGKGDWTVRNAVEGLQVFGGIGSGKTSGSGRMVALKYLEAGFGGLVLTAKPDERELWENDYCKITGRSKDLIVVSPSEKDYFNILEYVSSPDGTEKSTTENIVEVLKTVINASEQKSGGGHNDPFWENALDMLMSNVIDLCLLAYGKVSVQLLYDIAQSVPRQETELTEAPKNISAYYKAFKLAKENIKTQEHAYLKTLTEEELENLTYDKGIYEAEICERLGDVRTLKMIDRFFTESFLNLNEKTRSIIDFSLTGFLFSLLREPIFSLFCRHASTFTPDDCLNGKIILLDIPVKKYHKVGRDSQIMFKYIWQRAMEKRDTKDNGRPVFLWADEAQNFLHEHDAEYQATARSSRIATVYISQNLPNYLANMGGAKPEYRVNSFLGTLATKIFHANADIETNRYASELIGDDFFEETSKTATAAGQFSSSRSRSIKTDRVVRPEEFGQLKTGGQLNGSRVEGYMHLQGNTLQNGLNHIKVQFNQEYIPQPQNT